MMSRNACLLAYYVLLGYSSVWCKTVYLDIEPPTPDEVSFMKRYGYLPDEQGEMDFAYTPHSISEAVKKMQSFAGLPRTGILDVNTRKLFNRRRCGVKDVAKEDSSSSRKRRYIAQEGWNKRTITYKVINGANTLEKARVERQLEAALAMWAPHARLHFTRQGDGHADIQVSFVRANHGDGFPFDGPGRVVAHAFTPPHGAMHFDDDEVWTDAADTDDTNVTDLFAVAVHEVGHALGLSHSNVKASVMYPYYQVPVEKLHLDDILGMQELYSSDQLPEDLEPAMTESSIDSLVPRFTKADSAELDDDIPDLCYCNYDTLQVIHGKIYVFEEEWVWVLSDRKVIEAGYPKRFHQVFDGLPTDITIIRTIYQRLNGNVVIFSGRNYWEFDPSFKLIEISDISDYWIPAHVPELTTVFLSNYNNKTYLIQYERFWRFDEQAQRMDDGYPKDMSAWRQVPYPIDSALIWKQDTFFFRGPRYWRFDNEEIQAHEYYPLPTALLWFPCPPTADMDRYVTNDEP